MIFVQKMATKYKTVAMMSWYAPERLTARFKKLRVVFAVAWKVLQVRFVSGL